MITDMTVAMKADSNLSCTTAVNITNVLYGAVCIYFMHIVYTSYYYYYDNSHHYHYCHHHKNNE